MTVEVDKYADELPAIQPIHLTNIPQQLKDYQSWLNWEWFKDKNNKSTKRPLNGKKDHAITGVLTFSDALDRCNDKVGLGFSAIGNDIHLIDLDDVLSGGEWKEDSKYLEPLLNTYLEISPSGKGLRAFGLGEAKTKSAKKGDPLEIYNSGRFVTVTGDKFNDRNDIFSSEWFAGQLLDSVMKKHYPDNVVDLFPKREYADNPAVDLIRMTNMLPILGAEDRDHWIDYGMIIHKVTSGSNQGLILWSMQSFATDPEGKDLQAVHEDCQQYWSGFNRADDKTYSQLTIGTMIARYNNIQRKLLGKQRHFPNKEGGVAAFNARYCTVMYEGDFRVVDSGKKGDAVTVLKKADFLSNNAHYTVSVPTANGKDTEAKALASIWVAHGDREMYDKVVFEPNVAKQDHNAFNLYSPHIVPPCEIDQEAIDLFYELVTLLCDGDEAAIEYFIDFWALKLQRPWFKTATCVVSTGGKGVGKSIFGQLLSKLFGQYYMETAHSSSLTNEFNIHLRHCLVMNLDEAVFAKDRSVDSIVKQLISGSEMTYNIKNGAIFTAPNHTALYITSNHADTVRATADERRYLICTAGKKKDRSFYDKFGEVMFGGDDVSKGWHSVHHWLMGRSMSNDKISGMRMAPSTAGLLAQKADSLEPIEQFWDEVLELGLLPTGDELATLLPISSAEDSVARSTVGIDGFAGCVSEVETVGGVKITGGDVVSIKGDACLSRATLYEVYKAWCVDRRLGKFDIKTSRAFSTASKKFLSDGRGFEGWSGGLRKSQELRWWDIDRLLDMILDWQRSIGMA